MLRLDYPSGCWKPLLEGADADAAREVVAAIAEALVDPLIVQGPVQSAQRPSLGGGSAGLAVFYDYFHRIACDAGYDDLATRHLDVAIEGAGQVAMPPSLYGGFTGVAWALAHLQGGADDGDDPSEAVDTALLDLLAREDWSGDYDLVSGLVGFGVYALERLPRPGARRLLNRIIYHLSATAQLRDDGATWWTAPALLSERAEEFPTGYYNLGLAHGVPGVIAMLSNACLLEESNEVARSLLDGAVRWILQHRLDDARGVFPSLVVPGRKLPPARTAWCYGDPGVAAALLGAARRVGATDWAAIATEIARRAAAVSEERAGVKDAGICHGSAGLAHIFHGFFHATGEAVFADAARRWYRRTLALRRTGEGIAGYSAWGRSSSGNWHADPGFVKGAAGVGLVLLGAVSTVPPTWNRVLMLDL